MTTVQFPYIPYIPAANWTRGGNLPPTRVVMHCTVGPCRPGAARDVARYFQRPEVRASAHMVGDPAEVIRCVPDDGVAWHAPPNTRSLGFELCDPLTTTADPARWQDDNHQSMLRLASAVVRGWCDVHGIPVRFINEKQLLAGEKGITDHGTVARAWGLSDHWDVGPGFPWKQFLDMVKCTDKETDMAMTTEQENKLDQMLLYSAFAAKRSGSALDWMALGGVGEGIDRIYREELNRSVDKGGLKTWTDQVMSNGASPKDVRKGVRASSEWKKLHP